MNEHTCCTTDEKETKTHNSHDCCSHEHEKRHDHEHNHQSMNHCGMEGHGGHGDHAAMFKEKFWISFVLTIPAVFYSHMLQNLFGYMAPMFPGSHWVAPIFAMIVFVYGGPVFLKAGWSEIKNKAPGMMLLISMGLIVAFFASLFTEFGWIDVDLWFELATLITIMLLGHWIEMRAVGQAQNALEALAHLLPDEAEVVDGDNIKMIKVDELKVGDIVLVRPGGKVPADGVIIEGSSDIDESMITGESKAVNKTVDDKVVAGTVSGSSAIRLRVDAVGEDTSLAGISRLVREAQNSRTKAQTLADRFAALLFYVAVASAFLTIVVWTLLGDFERGIENAVTVLIIACPHALGLAIPLTISVSSALAANNGILVKDRLALEKMRTIDTVLFDKTGTLTYGEHEVVGIISWFIG
ncbi:MAG: HAD-IC family P-type ATPase [Acidimicrobiia bacterium]